MIGFLIRMLLGLVLIALGFLFGAMYAIYMLYVPACILLQEIISPEKANHIVESLLEYEKEYGGEGKLYATFFYIIYRSGYIMEKMPYFGLFVDSVANPIAHKIFLDRITKSAKRKGIVIPEETKDEQK